MGVPRLRLNDEPAVAESSAPSDVPGFVSPARLRRWVREGCPPDMGHLFTAAECSVARIILEAIASQKGKR